MENYLCPQTNEPHLWERDGFYLSRSYGKVFIKNCNNCLAVRIEQDRYNTNTQTVTVVSPY